MGDMDSPKKSHPARMTMATLSFVHRRNAADWTDLQGTKIAEPGETSAKA